jgi:hypothetical protein
VIAGEGPLWRVGYHAAPLEFTPRELYGYSHRFDDVAKRFRTLYLSELDLSAIGPGAVNPTSPHTEQRMHRPDPCSR